MARNRYGWEKRTKELARKAKHDEKMKRRQHKSQTASESTSESADRVPEPRQDD